VSDREPFHLDQGAALLALYDSGVDEVYGYLRRRTPDDVTAEDLTSETFLGAVRSIESGTVAEISAAWLVGIARHKLADHWRRLAREDRKLQLVEPTDATDPTDQHIDAAAAHATLAQLAPHHRAVLTFRYLDGLPVRQVADLLDRTPHATEALLIRAKHAFRLAYGEVTP